MADHRDDFKKMCDQWDAALKKGIFKQKASPGFTPEKCITPSDGDYGMTPQMAAVAANSENVNDADYWNAIFRLSRGEDVGMPTHSPTVIQEELQVRSDGTNANPVPCWTKGKDQNNAPSHWFDRDDFEKLVRMKEDLHSLGDKLSTHDGKGERVKSEAILKKIRNLQREIDSLSSSLLMPREEKK